jgi:hypothetical protein
VGPECLVVFHLGVAGKRGPVIAVGMELLLEGVETALEEVEVNVIRWWQSK